MRVKYCTKNAQVKERAGGGEERKETLADKPPDFENCPLGPSCLSSRTDIQCCHQLSKLTNKMFGFPWSRNEL